MATATLPQGRDAVRYNAAPSTSAGVRGGQAAQTSTSYGDQASRSGALPEIGATLRSMAPGHASPTLLGAPTLLPSPVIAQGRRTSISLVDVHGPVQGAGPLASPDLAMHRTFQPDAHRVSVSPRLGHGGGRMGEPGLRLQLSPSQTAHARFDSAAAPRPTLSPQLQTSRRLADVDGAGSPRPPLSPLVGGQHRRTSSGLIDAVQIDSGHQIKLFDAFAQHVEAVSALVDRAADVRTPAHELRKSVFMLADHYVRTSKSALGYYGLAADQVDQLERILSQLHQSSAAAQSAIDDATSSATSAPVRSRADVKRESGNEVDAAAASRAPPSTQSPVYSQAEVDRMREAMQHNPIYMLQMAAQSPSLQVNAPLKSPSTGPTHPGRVLGYTRETLFPPSSQPADLSALGWPAPTPHQEAGPRGAKRTRSSTRRAEESIEDEAVASGTDDGQPEDSAGKRARGGSGNRSALDVLADQAMHVSQSGAGSDGDESSQKTVLAPSPPPTFGHQRGPVWDMAPFKGAVLHYAANGQPITADRTTLSLPANESSFVAPVVDPTMYAQAYYARGAGDNEFAPGASPDRQHLPVPPLMTASQQSAYLAGLASSQQSQPGSQPVAGPSTLAMLPLQPMLEDSDDDDDSDPDVTAGDLENEPRTKGGGGKGSGSGGEAKGKKASGKRSAYIKWTLPEDEHLIRAICIHGQKWEAVSKAVPDRTYHQCRQRFLRGLKSGASLPAGLDVRGASFALELTRADLRVAHARRHRSLRERPPTLRQAQEQQRGDASASAPATAARRLHLIGMACLGDARFVDAL